MKYIHCLNCGSKTKAIWGWIYDGVIKFRLYQDPVRSFAFKCQECKEYRIIPQSRISEEAIDDGVNNRGAVQTGNRYCI